MNHAFQSVLRFIEVGEGQAVTRIVPLAVILLVIGVLYDFGPFDVGFSMVGGVYRGLSDAQSMDNAQLARQIVRGQGFTTKFLRPYAVMQLHDYSLNQGLLNGGANELFPAAQFPKGAPRILPDTYNAPGYPLLLAAWFSAVRPHFDQPAADIGTSHSYSPDRWIPLLNQIFLVLTMLLTFAMGRRLFDERVAWLSMVALLGTDLAWQYTVTALSTSVLMFLVTAVLFCALEIFQAGEASFEDEAISIRPAWFWSIALALVLAVACLTKLYLLVLLVPLLLIFLVMPKAHPALFIVTLLLVLGLVSPWFWHSYKVSGNPLGSNMPLLLYGEEDYKGNQIFCKTSIPSYESLFKVVSKKEALGFRWNFEHLGDLLGSNPMVLLFGASLLYAFKRRRAQIFVWLVVACGLALVAANNVCVENPDPVGPWNALVLLLPCVLVIGSAFFLILLDRLNFQVWLLNNLIVIAMLFLTAFPLALTLTTTSGGFYSFPPYMPPVLKLLGQLAQPDEWVTSDMPWATAWYSDHASLWLPDSVTDFDNLNDSICPTGVMFFTPVTWSKPVSNLTTGEDKDWLPFALGGTAPINFPLRVHTVTPAGGPDYTIWSDRPRWQEQH